jgi:hypothetical protein
LPGTLGGQSEMFADASKLEPDMRSSFLEKFYAPSRVMIL